MLLDQSIYRIARKEITLFFASPVAYLFLACFAAVTLFVFFWVETFFSRNIADIRPLFEWMPILLIFLTAALTMRMWSEEKRAGTMEFVITLPVSHLHYVLGKFLACLVLLLIALILTLPLPLSVSMIANLDWGPVWAAYIATFLLGASYLSIGLFVSARSDNQIVSLIVSTIICSIFYLLGSNLLTDFFGNIGGELLRAIGSGSRFDSITRGVIDFRDLYYYLSIIAVFIVLNVFVLEQQRWAHNGNKAHHKNWYTLTGLLALNALAANLWLANVNWLRVDVTEGQMYSLSPATDAYLTQLREPLLIRGYFSAKTHPLLAPLVPQLRDLINEYEVAGNGNVRVEFIDPVEKPELEEEANSKYGIKPVPFQVSDRYQAALVNSYFNILIQYGDEYQVLGFRDLIEVKSQGEDKVDVQLRNPEYDISRSVKKVLYGFQSAGNLFDSIRKPVSFTGYFSADSVLPEVLAKFKTEVNQALADYQKQAGDKLKISFVEPEANGGEIAKKIQEEYGFKPMAASLFDTNTFYYYMTLSSDDVIVQVPLPSDLKPEGFKRSLETGLKRFASGFMKTVLMVKPAANPYAQYGGGSAGKTFDMLREVISENMTTKENDLKTGKVPEDADIMLVLAPDAMDKKQLFAIDQFLMQGGTVMMSTSPFAAKLENKLLSIKKQDSGIADWLKHHGVEIEEKLVLDPQNSAFPVPVTRNVMGLSFQEVKMLDYPYFADIRDQGLNQDNAITADIQQITMAWSSPLVLDKEKNKGRQLTNLFSSSEKSWTSTSLDVMPKMDQGGSHAFKPEGKQESHLLAAVIAGKFSSFFKDQESPLLAKEKAEKDKAKDDADKAEKEEGAGVISGVIAKSPESSRLIIFSSNEFVEDTTLQLAGAVGGTDYINPLQLVANAVEWSLEDQGLLSIRSRGHFNRTLPPMTHDSQLFLEYLNYVLALLGIITVAILQRRWQTKYMQRYQVMISQGGI